MEIPASRLERPAMPRPHTQSQLCKRCAASAQRRSFPDSFPGAFEIFVALCMAEFAPANRTPILWHLNCLEEFEKPRLVSQRLVRRSPNQRRDIITGGFFFEEERIKGHLLLTD